MRELTVMLLFLETGIRCSDLIGIRLDDIRMKKGKILIHGKGAKQHLPFQSKLCRALKVYLVARGAVQTDALFCTITGKPLYNRVVQQAIRQSAEEAHITGGRCSPHTFRHTMAKFS